MAVQQKRVWPDDYPDLLAEWDRARNDELGPLEAHKASSDAQVWWRCLSGHSWRAPIIGRVKGSAKWECPFCSGFFQEAQTGRSIVDAYPHLAGYVDAVRGVPLSSIAAGCNARIHLSCGDSYHRGERSGKLQWLVRTYSTPCAACFWIEQRSHIPPGELVLDAPLAVGSDQEDRLRRWLAERLELAPENAAVKLRERFYAFPWAIPDILVPAVRVAIEYDSPGYEAGWHAGERAETDARKDALLRTVGWEVVRLRIEPLPPTSPFDVVAPRLTRAASAKVCAQVEMLSQLRTDRGLALGSGRAGG